MWNLVTLLVVGLLKKLKAGLSVDDQTFNLMHKPQNESFSIPNLTQNKRLCFESTNAPFSQKSANLSKAHNVFTYFLEDDSLNNLKHNDYVFVTIQNNCEMACHLNSELIQRRQLHFLNLYFINVKQLKLHILAGKEKNVIANSAFLTASLMLSYVSCG